jgi:Flp pilus assembly pilin Flp
MRSRASGQVSAEYAIVIGAIAVVCIAALVFVGFAVSERFESGGEHVRQGPLEPPKPSPSGLVWPTTVEECEDGGWRNFPQFADEEECREYVEGLTP